MYAADVLTWKNPDASVLNVENSFRICFPRRKLQQANEKLRKVLIEMIRCTITTEDMIGQKISGKTQTSGQATLQRSSAGNKDAQESGPLAFHLFSSCNALVFVRNTHI